MPSELGQTSDPKELIPGMPELIEDRVNKLRTHAGKLDSIGGDLKKIDVISWGGEASHAFREMFSKEPPKWLKCSDSVTEVVDTVDGYVGTLRWAQSQAGQAIDLWEQGDTATRKATTHYNNALTQVKNNPATGNSEPIRFVDPGEKLREDARQILREARAQLRQAGDQATQRIGTAQVGDGALGALVDAATSEWISKSKTEAQGLAAGFEMSGPKDGKLGLLRAFAQLGKASAEGSIGNELFQLNGKAQASAAAEATLAASLTEAGFKARGEAAVAGQASAEGRAQEGPLGQYGRVDAFAGARAGAQVSAGPTGVEGKVDAFAGGRVGGKIGADVGGIGVNITGEAWAGAGVEGVGAFGQDEHGVWRAKVDGGVADVLGGSAGFEVSVDPAKVKKTFHDAAEVAGREFGGSPVKTISGWI